VDATGVSLIPTLIYLRRANLQQHTTLAAQSECASLKINAFFQNGTLPGDDNSCALEAGPWNVTLSSMEERRDWRSVQFKKV
jgi:hypothetical protein